MIFRFGRDPVCLAACGLYALNRWLLLPLFPGVPFLHSHFNDTLLVPAALPWVLFIQNRLGWRGYDLPTWGEIGAHWAIWSVICELVAPLLFKRATGDVTDVLAYGLGALIAGCVWQTRGWLEGKRGFDRLAPFYGVMENLVAGGILMRARMAHLDAIPDGSRLLLAGEGHGRFLSALVRQRPSLAITCADMSGAMLERSREMLRRSRADRHAVEFIECDLRAFRLHRDTYDVIVTHFFLDCFEGEELRRVVENLADAAKADARWLLADFQIPDRGVLRLRARAVVWLMYRFFRCATHLSARQLEPPGGLLEALGFQVLEKECWNAGLIYSEHRKRTQ